MSRSAKRGLTASTASASSSSTATQPGPLSAHWASTIAVAIDAEHLRNLRATSDSSTGPERISGGAAKPSPSGVSADAHEADAALLHDLTVVAAGVPPASSQAWQRAERRVPGKRQLAPPA